MRIEGFDSSDDSLDERRMVMEMLLMDEVRTHEPLSLEAREQLIREILDRPDMDEFWNDDDASAILVRKPGPKKPKGQSGVAVCPDAKPDEIVEDDPKFLAPRHRDSLGDIAGV